MSMPATIRRLPATLANQIAAGEVIERPASVVRELVENALDAGATTLRISVHDAGLTSVEVLDNGYGIPKDSLALALERHATSKLLTTDDLFNITTFGFRGEALPSIASVARLTLTSHAQGTNQAWSVNSQGTLKPAALPPGTRVHVADLFYATPARRKFLKSARTERAALNDILLKLALAHPAVTFTLLEDGAESWHIPAAQGQFGAGFDDLHAMQPRLAALLGADFAHAAVPLFAQRPADGPHSAKTIHGFISRSTYHTGSNRQQFFYVNQRPVKDKTLQTALRQAYTDLLPAGRHPLGVLFLTISPAEVDVNVHPAKAEVRFRDPSALFGFLYAAVRQALAQTGHSQHRQAAALPALAATETLAFQSPLLPTTPHQLRKGDVPQHLAEPTFNPTSSTPNWQPITSAETPDEPFPLGAAIGQLDTTYLLAEAADGTLIVVDQHAAHERLVYEKLKQQVAAQSIAVQPLLLPTIVTFTPADADLLLDHAPQLAQWGLEIARQSPTAIVVTALPQLLADANPVPLLRDLLNDLHDLKSRTALQQAQEKILATMACHHSIRAHRRLSLNEMNSLLRQLEATPATLTCNHGRPTVVQISRTQLEKLFARR